MIATLMGRAVITPADLQALRDQVAMLEGRADITPADLQALRDQVAMLEGRADITPADLQALRDQVAMLEGRADITPADLQALRDQVAMLEGRADITPADLQALRDQVAMLEGRADITPADLQALRDQVAMLEGRADITPADLQALRDQVAMLEGQAVITPADIQALRDQVAMLEGRADITPADLQALRDQVAMLEGRADITPDDLQALRNEIAALEQQQVGLLARLAPEEKINGVPLPIGLIRSTATPVYATDADSYRSAGLETQFPALSALIVRDWNDSTVTLGSDLHVKSIAGDTEDASGNVEIMVTYELEGEEITVSFTDGDFETAYDGTWTKEIDGITYSFWFSNDSFRHFSITGTDACGGPCLWTYSTIGARTDPAHMPAGSATYYGIARADSFLKNEPSSNPNRQRIYGALRLTADFGGSTLEGRITDIQVRKHNESSRTDWPESTYLAIDGGQIVDGQFTAKLTGMDSNANAPMDQSLGGYEGDVLGEFYGPAAEEVGAVFNASRNDRVLLGWFGGAQFDPDRLAGSSRTPVSVGVDRDFSASTTQLTDAASVTAVESDGADGFYVTYIVDGAAQRIHLPVSVYDSGDRIFETEGPPDYGIWDQANSYSKSAEFDHFSVNGWYVTYETAPDGSQTALGYSRGYMVYGEPTAVLPAGTAEYAGRVYLNGWSRTDPSSSEREQFLGSLALTADFDNRTIGGLIDDWSFRAYSGNSGYEDFNAETVIQNGTIMNNELSAELVRTGRSDFTGNMTGQFFGPGAAEVGGVIDGEDRSHVYEGWFGGKKQ